MSSLRQQAQPLQQTDPIIQHAIVRDPGPDAAEGLTAQSGPPLCLEQLQQQHAAYCDALAALGVELIRLDPAPGFPDAYFVEDTAVVTPEIAIIARSGALQRRGEEQSVARVLGRYRKLTEISALQLSVLTYVASLRTPSSPWLPSTWAYNALHAALEGTPARGLLDMALLWSGTGVLLFVCVGLADVCYFRGYSRTQAAGHKFRRRPAGTTRRRSLFTGPLRALLDKEFKTFWRDQTQWSQIFLIMALVVIYVYNFKVLPLEKSPMPTVCLQNLLAFLNMGLALFVLTAVTARFAFPAVCSEREAFWIIKISPISIRSFLWIKFCIYFLPLLILTEALIVITNTMLNVAPFMMGLSVLTVFAMVPGIVSLGIGMGALNPNFRTENPAQAVTGFDGLLFMIFSTAFIGAVLALEAGPVYHYFIAQLRHRPLPTHWYLRTWTSGLVVVLLCIAAAWVPMAIGQRRLERRGV